MIRTHVRPTEQGTGRVEYCEDGAVRLAVTGAGSKYANAQLDDYQGLPRRKFPWRPPLTLHLNARFELGPGSSVDSWEGTAGFGLWNGPFGGKGRLPVLPTAIWYFFGGRSTNMDFARNVSGRGWKAACIRGHSRWGYGLMPLAPLGALLFRSQALYRRLWPWAQRRLGIAEAQLDSTLMHEWHTYCIEWGVVGIEFRIDNEIMHHVPLSITTALGCVIWIDNQYLVATPQGRLRWGVAQLNEHQSLVVRNLEITPKLRPLIQPGEHWEGR